MNYPTLVQCFLTAVDTYPNPRAQMHKEGGRWESTPSAELLRRVAGLATSLAQSHIFAGDRVALFSPNRPEWHVADLAALGMGAVTVPIYYNESADRMVYILNHSEAKAIFAVGPAQVDRVLACRDRLPSLETVIVAAYAKPVPRGVLRFDDMIGRSDSRDINAFTRRAAEVKPGDLASIIYTSGTTGEPKGVMLTHSNFSSNALDSLRESDARRTDVTLSFLPLSHVYERIMGYSALFRGVAIAYVERMDDVPQALLEVRPTSTAAVPRFFEKTYAGIMEARQRLDGPRRQLLDWGLGVAREAIGWRGYGRPLAQKRKLVWYVANLVVFRRIRRRLGGRIRVIYSGGGPLGRDLAEFFWSIGVPVLEGYGLTETSPIVSSSTLRLHRPGTVGRPIPNVEVRTAEDGELLVRGPCVMKGYYKAAEQTAEAIDADGWLHTGDIGHLDADGYLEITDRKKELLKTSGGKLVAPQPIENLLKTSACIANACVVGDRRKFVAVLVVPNFEALRAKGREAGLSLGPPAEIALDPWAQKLVGEEIARLTEPLAQYERPKRYVLLDRDFTPERGELTYTLKLRRRVVEEHFQTQIEQLYADVAEPRPTALG